MQQRVIKIILPDKLKDSTLELLDAQEKIHYWLEEIKHNIEKISRLLSMVNFEVQ